MTSPRRKIITGAEIPSLVENHASGVQDIMLCSPFVTRAGMKPLLDRFKRKKKVRLDIISRFDEIEWLTGVTEPDIFDDLFKRAMKYPGKWDVKVWLVDSLHAKAIVLGNKVAIIGSANITGGGFENNHEMGVMLDQRSAVEAIRKRLEYYKDAGVELTPQGLSARRKRLDGEEGGRIKALIKSARGRFQDRRCPGLIEFTREKHAPLDYSQHVFEFLQLIGTRRVATDELRSWLDHNAVIAAEPKASMKRIFFLESLGLIEETEQDAWSITERGKEVLQHGKPALYRRLRNRWRIIATLEDVFFKRYNGKTFTASALARRKEFQREGASLQAVTDSISLALRWLRSLDVVESVHTTGTRGKTYRLATEASR